MGGLVGLRVMSASGKTTAIAFLADDGSICVLLKAENLFISSWAHVARKPGYLIKGLVSPVRKPNYNSRSMASSDKKVAEFALLLSIESLT